MEETKDINRIKVVLVEKKRTNKWLAEQLGKDPQQCLNGARTLRNRDWKHCCRLPVFLMLM